MNLLLRIATAVCLALSGFLHAQLYVGGYRVIPVIGPAFLAQPFASPAGAKAPPAQPRGPVPCRRVSITSVASSSGSWMSGLSMASLSNA
jgi:hypothetical protein